MAIRLRGCTSARDVATGGRGGADDGDYCYQCLVDLAGAAEDADERHIERGEQGLAYIYGV